MWQLGDSAEQNGTFNIEINKTKADTVRCKNHAGLPTTLERSDIIRIVNIACQKLFSRVDMNLEAISERGCPELNDLGSTPEAGWWNIHDLKVVIQCCNHDGDKSMPKNKEGLLLRYRETHTHIVQGGGGAYPHNDVDNAVDGCQESSRSASRSASSAIASQAAQSNCKTFYVTVAGFQAATCVAPTVVTVATTATGVAIAIYSALAQGTPTTDVPHLIFSQMPLQMTLV
jgi:hypothetical protein